MDGTVAFLFRSCIDRMTVLQKFKNAKKRMNEFFFFFFLPVVSRVRRYATTVHIVPAQHEGNGFASSAIDLSIL